MEANLVRAIILELEALRIELRAMTMALTSACGGADAEASEFATDFQKRATVQASKARLELGLSTERTP